MIKNKKPQLEIDNEYSRLSEKHALEKKLTQKGYINLKRITEKFWSGIRLDNQELGIAYVLCPKLILYEKITYRMLDLVLELEKEVEKRWGTPVPPQSSMMATMKMVEPNPDYVKDSQLIIMSVWQNLPMSRVIEGNEMSKKMVRDSG